VLETGETGIRREGVLYLGDSSLGGEVQVGEKAGQDLRKEAGRGTLFLAVEADGAGRRRRPGGFPAVRTERQGRTLGVRSPSDARVPLFPLGPCALAPEARGRDVGVGPKGDRVLSAGGGGRGGCVGPQARNWAGRA